MNYFRLCIALIFLLQGTKSEDTFLVGFWDVLRLERLYLHDHEAERSYDNFDMFCLSKFTGPKKKENEILIKEYEKRNEKYEKFKEEEYKKSGKYSEPKKTDLKVLKENDESLKKQYEKFQESNKNLKEEYEKFKQDNEELGYRYLLSQ